MLGEDAQDTLFWTKVFLAKAFLRLDEDGKESAKQIFLVGETTRDSWRKEGLG